MSFVMNITKAKLNIKNEFNNTVDQVYLTIDNVVYLVPFDPDGDYQSTGWAKILCRSY